MNITTVETTDEFKTLAGEWNELLDNSPSRSVFLTHEWLFTWWKHLAENRRLSVVLARDGERLVGILPLAKRPPDIARLTPETLEFLGSGVIGSDYLDVIVRQDCEKPVLNAFADWLDRQSRVLQLSQVRTGACDVESLGQLLAARGWRVSESRINVCPFINLANQTWDGYLASLGSSQRYNFQRRVKNLMKLPGFQFERAKDPKEAATYLDVLIGLHAERWASRGEASEAFQTSPIRAFHHELAGLAATRGWLRLFNMWIDGRPAAALYGLRYGTTFSFYQSGFSPEFTKQSVGLVTMGLAIRSAIEEGAVEYDFLHGGEEYKYHWATQTKTLGRLEFFPGHARARVYQRAMDFNRAARRMAKRVLQSL